jgi:Fur family transcriptional regulator, ferric uptake regulator
LKIVCDIEEHFRPEELQSKLIRQGHQVSLTTVYRNLALLVQAGIVRRAVLNAGAGSGGALYEHIWGREHHDHLVCSRCGKRVNFYYPAIDVLQEAAAREHGFVLETHHLELIGICPDCAPAHPGRSEREGGSA